MKNEKIRLWETGEYFYNESFGFIPNITTYVHEDELKRDFVLVAPGGGYSQVSPTEGEIVAKAFYNKGYNAVVLTYTINLMKITPLEKQPLKDIARAVRYIRVNNTESKIILCGFSAGGHLCGSLAVHFDDVEDINSKYKDVSARPDACILSYPVITSGEFAHKGSIENLIGFDAYQNNVHDENLEYFSLEKQVKENTSPCFVWHTVTDATVPVENAIMFSRSLMDKNINCALHLFSEGRHGLSLSNELWASGEYGELYTREQTFNVINAIKDDIISLDADVKVRMLKEFEMYQNKGARPDAIPVKEVEAWFNLSIEWLNNVI